MTGTTPGTEETAAEPVVVTAETAGATARHPLRALTIGEFPELRVLIVIAIIWTIFWSQNDRFLSASNLTNLCLQIAAVGTISIGVVLILLLGEIDLSVGSVSGLCAAITAVLSVKHGWSPVVALLAGLAAGASIGLFNGFFVTFFGIPSFVVTLAGLIGWQGALLWVLGETGTVNLPTTFITDLTTTFYSGGVAWLIAAVGIAGYIGAQLWTRRRRVAAGLPAGDVVPFVVKSVFVAAAIIAAVWKVNSDRGIPLSFMILVGLCLIFAFITTRTRFGRHIYAVGGNAEAARRAGIKVNRVYIAVFMLASTLAATGGILAASRLLAVNQSSGASDLLLLAIAGPVVAGTSLFGGRGSVWHALLGALVIGSISNGMDLLALQSSTKFMITGAVLLGAVTLDAATRKRRAQVMRA